MYGVVKGISGLLKLKQITTSDINFLINTKLTVFMLILFSVLLSFSDLFRASIDCYTAEDKKKSIIDNYCWSIGTFTCPSSYSNSKRKKKIAIVSFFYIQTTTWALYILLFFLSRCFVVCILELHKLMGCSTEDESDRIYQKYYQWTTLIFVIQACILYLPAYLWKISEGGLMQKLCNDLGKIFSFLLLE